LAGPTLDLAALFELSGSAGPDSITSSAVDSHRSRTDYEWGQDCVI
jgi:hypothetical protein